MGVDSEFADVFIRLLDACNTCGVDPVAATRTKMDYNHSRDFRHGGRRL